MPHLTPGLLMKNRKKGKNFAKLTAKAGQRRALIPHAAIVGGKVFLGATDFEDTIAAAAKQLKTCYSMLSHRGWGP